MEERYIDGASCIEKGERILSDFQAKVNSFFKDEAAGFNIAENFQSIRNCWDDERMSENQVKQISEVGKVIETSISSLDDLTSGEPVRIIKGCLNIAQSVSIMIGGPYGAAASAICGILGAVLSQGSQGKPDMATTIIEEVKKEMKSQIAKFNRLILDQECNGLFTRMKTMVKLLKEVSDHEHMPDGHLIETDLPQFSGKVAANFIDFTGEKACKNCVSWVVLYCKVQTAHIMLLTVIIAAFKSSGRETKFIERQLESAKDESIEKLDFVCDEMQMRKKVSPSRNQTQLAICVRRNNDAYRVIEGFRKSLGMAEMPSLKELTRLLMALNECNCSLDHVIPCYPQPHTKGDHHYFQMINHTEFPILVKCGDEVGKKGNVLQFKKLNPYSSYEHAVTTKFNRTFSTGGVFAVYLEHQERSEENMLENDGSRMKVFEFALSNPLVGKCKSAILDTSHDFSPSTNGQTCWDEMNNGTKRNELISFEDNHGECYIASTAYSPKGKNRRRTCRFVVLSPHCRPYRDAPCDLPKSGTTKIITIKMHSREERDEPLFRIRDFRHCSLLFVFFIVLLFVLAKYV